jgi:hypothetical protein
VNAFAETINNGILNPNRRLSYRQWLPILDAFAEKDNGAPYINASKAQSQPLHPTLISIPVLAVTPPALNIAIPLHQNSHVSVLPAPMSKNPFTSKNYVWIYTAAAFTILLTLAVYSWSTKPAGRVNDKSVVPKDDVAALSNTQPTYLRFQDSNLNEVSLEDGKISSKVFYYLKPVIRIAEINNRHELEYHVRIIAPGGRTIDLRSSRHNDLKEMDELVLKTIAFGCPKCSTGTYRVEIYADTVVIGVHSFEVY